jgi:hypothetical protein
MWTQTVWVAGAVVVAGYLLLFMLARRPVTLRLGRLGWLLAALVVLRLVLAWAGLPLEGWPEWIATVLLGLTAIALVPARRVWLVRSSPEALREQIQTACRGLFLGMEENPPGRLQLSAQGKPALLLRRLAPRIQVLVLCRVSGPGKVALLCDWLARQYPGPVPRLRFVLKGGAS